MENTLLISLDDVLQYSSINGSIDPFKLNPHILNAQTLYILDILGSDLYDKIIELVNADNLSGETAYNTLVLDYITPVLVFYTLTLFIPINSFQIAAGGTFQFTPNNANYSPLDDIDRVVKKYDIIGQKYTDILVRYLCKNKDLYPEYVDNDGLIDKTEPKTNAGWFTGGNYISKIRR